jgi:hypothetical protein
LEGLWLEESLGKKVHENPSQWREKLGIVVAVCHPSYSRKFKMGRSCMVQATLSKNGDPIPK